MKEVYKQTELGVIPENWEITKFENFASNEKWSITGGPFGSDLKTSDYTSNGIRMIQLQNIGDGIFNDEYKIYTSVEKANKLISCNIYPGDIILSKMGDPVARACMIPAIEERFVMASDGIRLSVDEQLFNKKFVHDYINSIYFRKRAIDVSTGSTRQRIGLPALKKLSVIKPPIEEQNAIANCLSTWDEAIDKQQELIEAKEIRHKALMQKLLSGKKRLPGFTDEWKFVRFKEFYSENKKQLGNDKLEVLSVTKNGIVSQSEYFNKEIASSDTSKYLIVEKDDFVVSGLNFWMGSFDVLTNFEIGVVSPAYKVFRLNKEFNNLYFKFLSKSKLMLDAMVGASIIGASIVRRNFDKEILYEWTFKIPSLEEQKKIGEFLENSSREIEIEKQKLKQLKEQKKALMQKLLTGKVRLPLNN